MNNFFNIFLIAIAGFSLFLFSGAGNAGKSLLEQGDDLKSEQPSDLPTAVFAGGCFWCVESEFRALDGVVFTRVGYMGGETENPKYKDITTGETGHAEVVEVTYDPEQVEYPYLVEFFVTKAHDPTQLNRQGVDVGTQYRSAIFPKNETQAEVARTVLSELQPSFDNKIVTTVEPYSTFWIAEEYHQQYYEKYRTEKGKDHIRVVLKKAGKLKP